MFVVEERKEDYKDYNYYSCQFSGVVIECSKLSCVFFSIISMLFYVQDIFPECPSACTQISLFRGRTRI